uniref:Uncharacterized protein n=1 Tax=Acrobeloides nanus TaxID=290746 RepID=A0A914ERG2_9BILA
MTHKQDSSIMIEEKVPVDFKTALGNLIEVSEENLAREEQKASQNLSAAEATEDVDGHEDFEEFDDSETENTVCSTDRTTPDANLSMNTSSLTDEQRAIISKNREEALRRAAEKRRLSEDPRETYLNEKKMKPSEVISEKKEDVENDNQDSD